MAPQERQKELKAKQTQRPGAANSTELPSWKEELPHILECFKFNFMQNESHESTPGMAWMMN
jgi:hypothetical protein